MCGYRKKIVWPRLLRPLDSDRWFVQPVRAAENEDTENIPVVDASDDDTFPVITNLKTWLRSDFEDC